MNPACYTKWKRIVYDTCRASVCRALLSSANALKFSGNTLAFRLFCPFFIIYISITMLLCVDRDFRRLEKNTASSTLDKTTPPSQVSSARDAVNDRL
jgi:hypothetical protein